MRSAHYPMRCNVPWTSGCLQYPCPLQKHGRTNKSSRWCRPAAELCDQSLWPLNHIQYISIHEHVHKCTAISNKIPIRIASQFLKLVGPFICPCVHQMCTAPFSFANRQIAKNRRFSHGNQPSIVFINLTHSLQTPQTTVIPCLQQLKYSRPYSTTFKILLSGTRTWHWNAFSLLPIAGEALIVVCDSLAVRLYCNYFASSYLLQY